ncbi:MAG: hypothetical protein WEB03_09050 [Nitriliruptor sp.]|uniref:hypothetical protein n=1 Tax=Nitriliruptor sp. TaxID=2448056 RepID=UPI00349FF08C
MARRFRSTALVVFLAVAAAACSSGGDDPVDEPTPTESAAPTVEPDPDPTETEPEDPFAIPDEIDEAYVESVMNELFRIRTEVIRRSVEANGQAVLPEDVGELIGASHSGPLRTRTIEDAQEILQATNVDEIFLAPEEMGEERFDLFTVVAADADCLVVTGLPDSGEVNRAGSNTTLYSVYALSRSDAASETNRTPWLLHDESQLFEGGSNDPAAPELVADLELDELRALIDDTCGGAV